MVKETSTEHKKHANLSKPKLGTFARNEWAFIGAPCGEIRKLMEILQAELNKFGPSIYMDESHNHDKIANSPAQVLKMQNSYELEVSKDWNRNENFTLINQFTFCLINGNHFKASKQFVFLNPDKKESLSRKLDRLTNVSAFIKTSNEEIPYEFLKNHIPNWNTLPILDENDVTEIAKLIIHDFEIPPIKALVLAGGKSVRMGKDKGKIKYHDEEQRSHMYNVLNNLVEEVYMSCRSDQEMELSQFNLVIDKMIGVGPYGAIVSAFMQDSNAAWLVVPCDLPLLKEEHIKHLINNRNPFSLATAYHNSSTKFPEPLISIWEPRMYQQMLQFQAQGFSCPRKVLINSNIQELIVKDQNFMKNVNTPEEFKEIEIMLKG